MNVENLKIGMNRLAERIEALDVESDAHGHISGEHWPLLTSDMDLDVAECRRQMHALAMQACDAWADPRNRTALCCLVADALVQGVVTGILHERARVEREREAGS